MESIATGLLAGSKSPPARGSAAAPPPARHRPGQPGARLAHADPANYQPVNITLALLPPVDEAFRRRYRSNSDRHRGQVEDALTLFDEFIGREKVDLTPNTQNAIG